MAHVELELSCNTQLACTQCGHQDFRIAMECNEETNEVSTTLVNNVECSKCHALYQVNLVRPDTLTLPAKAPLPLRDNRLRTSGGGLTRAEPTPPAGEPRIRELEAALSHYEELQKSFHAANKLIEQLEAALAAADAATKRELLFDTEIYYLKSILGHLREVESTITDGPSLGGGALTDNIDFLDCFIDKHERKKKAAAIRSPKQP